MMKTWSGFGDLALNFNVKERNGPYLSLGGGGGGDLHSLKMILVIIEFMKGVCTE